MNTNLEILKVKMEAKLKNFAVNLRKDDEMQFVAEMLHLDFMHLVKQKMEELHLSKKDLADKLGTSKGYISQLFSGDKLVNLVMIARLQNVLGIQFEITIKKNNSMDKLTPSIQPFKETMKLRTIQKIPNLEIA